MTSPSPSPSGRGSAEAYSETCRLLDEARSRLWYAPAPPEEETNDHDEELANLLLSVGSQVAGLTRESHYTLVERLFDGVTQGKGLSPWFLMEKSRRALLGLVTHLVVSGSLASTALYFLVRSFCPPLGLRQWPPPWDQSPGIEARCRARQRSVLEDLKRTVLACLRMAPTLHEEVVQQVLAKWPHKYVDKFRSECFLTVSFWLALGQLKSASNRILARAVVFLVELDVETKWDGVSDLGPLEDFPSPGETFGAGAWKKDGDGDVDELDEADMFEVCTVQDQQDHHHHTTTTSGRPPRAGPNNLGKKKEVDPSLEKLDALLLIALQYVKSTHDDGDGAEVHETLLSTFQRSVFPVQKTRLVQFLVFYSLSRRRNCKKFVAFLSSVYANASAAEEERGRALMYLGSFVARSETLPLAVALEVMSMIANWCMHFCQHNHPGRAGENGAGAGAGAGAEAFAKPEGWGTFCFACQALLHSLTFLLATTREVMQLGLLGNLCSTYLLQILGHWTHPLSECPTCILEDFLHQAAHLKIFGSETLGKLRQMHGSAGVDLCHPLPFKMYGLRHCGPFIASHSGLYRTQLTRPVGQTDHFVAEGPGAHVKIGSLGQRSDTSYGQSPSGGWDSHFGGSYISEEGDLMQYNQGGSTAREAWFEENQRPIPIGMKAQELVHSRYFGGSPGGFGTSPGGFGISGSMSTDHSPDVSMSLGVSLNDNKFTARFSKF